VTVLEVTCPRCRTENTVRRLFCHRCGAILEPRTDLWLQLEDFQCPPDKEALEIVESTGILVYLVDQFLVKPRERKQREWLSKRGLPSSHFEDLEPVVEECAYLLSLATLPEVYVVDGAGPPNAFTFGRDSAPVIVMDRRLLQIMGRNELRALLGHEMGHIKSRHLLYHSLANTLAEGVGISTSLMGLGIISTAMRMALLAWRRESEFSADRAALISSGDPNHVASMFAALLHTRPMSISDHVPLLQDLAGIFQSHPNHLERVKAVFQFSKSDNYANIVEKMNRRKMFREALTLKCRFCGASKPVEALFCPECGRSQV
jgi:Zn-dependent protease with chaperone function